MKHLAARAAVLLAAALFAACDQSPTSTELAAPNFAKPGGGTTTADPTATFYLPALQGSLGLWGDNKYTDNSYSGTSRYKEKECGVHSKIFYNGSGDAIMNSTGDPRSASKCTNAPRKINVDFSKPLEGLVSGGIETLEAFINTLDVQDNTTADGTVPIEIGQKADRPLNLSLTGSKICDGLRFRPTLPAYNDQQTGAEYVDVTRIDERTWRVQTKTDAKAACIKNDAFIGLYVIPVDFYIVADQSLPT